MNEMKCAVCGRNIRAIDKYHAYMDIVNSDGNLPTYVCENCGVVTTVYDLYSLGLMELENSEDDAIESTGVVIEAKEVTASAYGAILPDGAIEPVEEDIVI